MPIMLKIFIWWSWVLQCVSRSCDHQEELIMHKWGDKWPKTWFWQIVGQLLNFYNTTSRSSIVVIQWLINITHHNTILVDQVLLSVNDWSITTGAYSSRSEVKSHEYFFDNMSRNCSPRLTRSLFAPGHSSRLAKKSYTLKIMWCHWRSHDDHL